MFVFCRWPDPLGPLIPEADGVDILMEQDRMAALARNSAKDPVGARAQAKQEASAYVCEGWTTRSWIWFWPTYLSEGEEAILFKAEDFGAKVESIRELNHDASFQRAMKERLTIRRAWGPLGLFWALLLESFEKHWTFKGCERCQRLITGKANKRFCGLQDDEKCYAARRALDQRESRNRRGFQKGPWVDKARRDG